jgi:hypothetical protein
MTRSKPTTLQIESLTTPPMSLSRSQEHVGKMLYFNSLGWNPVFAGCTADPKDKVTR